MGPRRDWSDARAKVEEEGACRVCAVAGDFEAAHITGRKHDEPKTPSSKTLYVKPERVVPLCRFGLYPDDPEVIGCHCLYDTHQLDLLGYLTSQEEAQAVLDLGSIESARRRLYPSAYRETRSAA